MKYLNCHGIKQFLKRNKIDFKFKLIPMKTHCLFLLLFFSITTHLCSQKIEWEGTLRAKAIAASNSNPFWFSSNTDNEISSDSQFSILGNMSGAYKISEKAMITAGGAFFFRNGFSSQFVRRDLYIQFKNSWLQATIGSKAGELYSKTSESPFNKLSVSNRNFVYSRNARPLPGLLLEAHNPIKISNNFSVDWGIAHYNLNDNRFISDTKVHYKQLTLIGKLNNNNTLTGQLQHFVQWGGDSPVFGELNKDFSTFVDVFFALKSPEINVEGERLNAVGNHIGSYLLTYDFVTSAGNFSIYKEHPFEDGSGIIFSNFPDGVLGIGYQPKNNKFINSLLYEFITTKNQSTQEPGFQSYFFNNVYRRVVIRAHCNRKSFCYL